jgi:hypothetical protein
MALKFKQPKNVEVEGGELSLRNSNGDIAIIPIKYRQQVEQWITEGNHTAIDELVSTLPTMANNAKKGLVVGEPPDTIKIPVDSTAIYEREKALQDSVRTDSILNSILKIDSTQSVNDIEEGKTSKLDKSRDYSGVGTGLAGLTTTYAVAVPGRKFVGDLINKVQGYKGGSLLQKSYFTGGKTATGEIKRAYKQGVPLTEGSKERTLLNTGETKLTPKQFSKKLIDTKKPLTTPKEVQVAYKDAFKPVVTETTPIIEQPITNETSTVTKRAYSKPCVEKNPTLVEAKPKTTKYIYIKDKNNPNTILEKEVNLKPNKNYEQTSKIFKNFKEPLQTTTKEIVPNVIGKSNNTFKGGFFKSGGSGKPFSTSSFGTLIPLTGLIGVAADIKEDVELTNYINENTNGMDKAQKASWILNKNNEINSAYSRTTDYFQDKKRLEKEGFIVNRDSGGNFTVTEKKGTKLKRGYNPSGQSH